MSSGPATATDVVRQFEVPTLLPIDKLDREYAGWVSVEALGQRDLSQPALIAAGAPLTEDLIDKIRAHARHLGESGEPLTHIRVAKRKAAEIARPREVVTESQRQMLFAGLSASFDNVKRVFEDVVSEPGIVFKKAEIDAAEKIKEAKIEVPDSFREQIHEVVQEILQNRNRATLFACLARSGEEVFDHSLRVFMMGTKLLAQLFQIPAAKFRQNRRIMNYAYGLLYHDTGMLFVPDEIRRKSTRLEQEEVKAIASALERKGLGRRPVTVIQAVNDPRYCYRREMEEKLSDELKKMHALVKSGILREEQFARLRKFPGHEFLTAEEQKIYEQHPIWSWEILRGSGFNNPHALDVVRHHHQRLDVTGFPDVQVAMTIEAQVAAAADLFDSLVFERPHMEPKAYDVAFGILDAMTAPERGRVQKFDRKIYELFAASVEKYPIGSFVRMNGGPHDGNLAQVIDYTVHNMNTPHLLVFRGPDGRRLEKTYRIGRRDYDGSFRLAGLPYTGAVNEEMLKEE